MQDPDRLRRRWRPISGALVASASIHLAIALAIGRGEPSPVSVTLRPPTLLEVSVMATREPPAQIATAEEQKPRPRAQARLPRASAQTEVNPAPEAVPVAVPAPRPETTVIASQATGNAPPAPLSRPAESAVPPAPASRPADPAAPSGAFVYAAYLHTPLPAYPSSARRLGQQGVVLVGVRVSREGIPGEVRLAKSSGFEALDEVALEAVRGWRFSPARRGGEPVASWIEVPVRFRLEE
ncbi:MAG: energy transducer TonB [Betaproteobacteria bacterium]|nr:energy transducer TonB [Betaproteobacteria bacterium]